MTTCRLKHAHEILKSTFGYDQFRHSQQEVIQELLDGNDALVLMPTGGGKSLCYQIPALVRKGTANHHFTTDRIDARSSRRLNTTWSQSCVSKLQHESGGNSIS